MENEVVFSVSDISQTLKNVVEGTFSHIQVKGEISGLKIATSGHVYFSLKDENAVLNAICWRGMDSQTKESLVEGQVIIACGKLSTYPGRSNYQMIVENARADGIGDLLKQLEDLKKKLRAEGLFDESHKKPLPFLPDTIGIITSPTGAVIRDMMHRINDRFPTPVILYPTIVQGTEAPIHIINGIKYFNSCANPPDVIIIARGGGSIEDLWCFNDENLARAVYQSDIPIISAVGHETDTTLIDYVSDKRAPTPTGAGEIVVPIKSELLQAINQTDVRLKNSLLRFLSEKDLSLKVLSARLPNLKDTIHLYEQKMDDRIFRLQNSIKVLLDKKTEKLSSLTQLLTAFSYERILDKGFAMVSCGKKVITSANSAQKQNELTLTFKDGKVKTYPKLQGELF